MSPTPGNTETPPVTAAADEESPSRVQEQGRAADSQPAIQEGSLDTRSPEGASAEPAGETREEATVEGSLAGSPQTRFKAENEALYQRLLRLQAEFENFRKRLLREKEEAHEYAAMGTIESLLPILDDFERALNAPGLDAEFREGWDLIYQRMFEVFTRAGLKPVETENTKFNPYFHHALDREPAENDEQDQTILEVYQRGYHFKDCLLRPAMVKVAVKETTEQTKDDQEEKEE
jgi:molecular chaperone GrpE